MAHPFHSVAIVGVHNTVQARQLDGHDSYSIALEGALGSAERFRASPSRTSTVS